MVYLIPEPVATKQVSAGLTESSPSRPTPSRSHQHPDKSKAPDSPNTSHRRHRCYSSDEEDDSRDRQSHWKRIKTRSDDDHPRGSGSSTRTLIRHTTKQDQQQQHGYDRSPPRSRAQAPNPRPGYRVIALKGSSVQEADAGLRRRSRESEERARSKGWDEMRSRDGGATSSKDIGFGGSSSSSSKRKHEVRVSSREARGFVVQSEGAGLLVEDSRHVDDDCVPARMFSGGLNRQSRGGGETMSTESSRGFGEGSVRVRRAEFDCSVGNGKGSSRRASRSGNDEGKDHGASLRAGASAAGAVEAKEGSGRDNLESERRHEKRERWAEKERDLEKETEKGGLPKTQSLTIVDYSHKFTVAQAPLSSQVKPIEVDPHRLCQRQKQIDYGKNTLGYERYTESVPRYQRTKAHPRTPDTKQVCSKRSWDGQIRKWRRLLHEYDPPKGDDEEDPDLMLAPAKEHDRSATEDSPIDMPSKFVEDSSDLKIYEGWSDDEC